MVCRGLFIFMGESDNKYTVTEFKRVESFLAKWIKGPRKCPRSTYPVLPPKDDDDCVIVPLISTFDELVGYLGPDTADRIPSEMCKCNIIFLTIHIINNVLTL